MLVEFCAPYTEPLQSWSNIRDVLVRQRAMGSEPKNYYVRPEAITRQRVPTTWKHDSEDAASKHVQSVVFLHDSVHIVGGSQDGTMQKWNCMGNPVGKPWKGKGGSIYVVALSPDGKTIACGRADGSVQQWNTDGKMEGAWWGHSDWVRSLSWSPSGNRLASGSKDGKILIRNTQSGEVEVGPIETNQREVQSLAYSSSGDRIASGGRNFTICIWDSTTGELVVGPIKTLGDQVTSVVWSSDSTKLYSASDFFARVFDSSSGALLHRFQHYNQVLSIALSPKNNVLACVGGQDIPQLWDTESHQLISQPSSRQGTPLYCVSFSRNGRYLACGGHHGKFVVWKVEDIAPDLSASKPPQKGLRQIDATQQQTSLDLQQQDTPPESPLSSCFNVDATRGDGITEMCDDPYNNFFPSSTSSFSQPSNLSLARRFWNEISRNPKPASTEPTPLQERRPKRKFLTRLTHSNSHPTPPTTTSDQSIPERELRAREEAEQIDQDPDLGALKPEKSEDQREESPNDVQRTSKLESGENRNIWRRLMGAQWKGPTSVNIAPTMKPPEVVKVYAVRGFQRYIASPKRWKKSPAVTYGVPLTAIHTGNSPQPGPSSQAGSAQAGTLLQASSGQGGPPSTMHGTHYVQVVGGLSSHASGPSHFVTTNYHTTHDSDSRSSIEGSCNRFLDKICFPRGHYH